MWAFGVCLRGSRHPASAKAGRAGQQPTNCCSPTKTRALFDCMHCCMLKLKACKSSYVAANDPMPCQPPISVPPGRALWQARREASGVPWCRCGGDSCWALLHWLGGHHSPAWHPRVQRIAALPAAPHARCEAIQQAQKVRLAAPQGGRAGWVRSAGWTWPMRVGWTVQAPRRTGRLASGRACQLLPPTSAPASQSERWAARRSCPSCQAPPACASGIPAAARGRGATAGVAAGAPHVKDAEAPARLGCQARCTVAGARGCAAAVQWGRWHHCRPHFAC